MGFSNLPNPFTVIISLISLCCLIQPSSQQPIDPSSSSIYDVLTSHGLPTGLFPKGITNYTVDPTTGQFEFLLSQACNAKFETDVHFEWNVSGTIGRGEIGNLSGVMAQDLFLWFPVKGIRVDEPSSGLIYFDVGVLMKQFSLSYFETPRDCAASDPISPSIDMFMIDKFRSDQKQPRYLENEADQQTVFRAIA